MGPLAVQTLFLKTLPDTMRAEIYKRPELKSLELMKLVDWARHQTVWERSEKLASQMLKQEKVMGTRIPSDMLTKHIKAKEIEIRMDRVGMKAETGRAKEGLKL